MRHPVVSSIRPGWHSIPHHLLGTGRGIRRVLAATAMAGLALPALSACGGDADDAAGDTNTAAGTPSGLDGIEEYNDLGRNHVEGTVDYPQNPPVGGDHAPVWVNCGAYSDPVAPEMAVHSLEHGAVWIAYDSSLDDEQVQQLASVADTNGYVLVSPVEDMDASVVATAWGVQLPLEEAGDERLAEFVTTYAQGPQTPEPGAPCTGGLDG